MTLYLLRHGLAVERGTPGFARDSERPLTPKGKRKLKEITQAMKAMDVSFDLILSSPYVRTRQTAKIVAEAFKARKKLDFSDSLTPDGNTKDLIDFINSSETPDLRIMLVGHEPYLSELISLLVAGDESLSIVMKKGGLCKLTAESLRHGRCAALEWLLTPKQMTLIAA